MFQASQNTTAKTVPSRNKRKGSCQWIGYAKRYALEFYRKVESNRRFVVKEVEKERQKCLF
jgi:hypothetical protein